MVFYGMVLYGMVLYGMVLYDVVLNGIVWYGMVQYCMVQYGALLTHVPQSGKVTCTSGCHKDTFHFALVCHSPF